MKIRKRGVFKKAWIEISAESGFWGDLDFGEGPICEVCEQILEEGTYFTEARNRPGFTRPRE